MNQSKSTHDHIHILGFSSLTPSPSCYHIQLLTRDLQDSVLSYLDHIRCWSIIMRLIGRSKKLGFIDVHSMSMHVPYNYKYH